MHYHASLIGKAIKVNSQCTIVLVQNINFVLFHFFAMKYLKFFVFVCLLFEITSTENEKRILLNDPDLMNARMDGLQHEIQAMKSELQTLKNQRSNQGTAHASTITYCMLSKYIC